jgi:hypothetical protein
MPMPDPFDVMRVAAELFGLDLAYAEAREVLIQRLEFRGYLALMLEPLPAWLTQDPSALPGPGTGDQDEPG